MITKLMFRCMIAAIKGRHTLKDIAVETGHSYQNAAKAVNKLCELQFLHKDRTGFGYDIQLNNNSFVTAFIEMYFKQKPFRLEELLTGRSFDYLLLFSISGGKTINFISKLLHEDKMQVYHRIAKLKKTFIIYDDKKTKMLYFNDKVYLPVLNFLKEFRTFTVKNVSVVWKYKDEILFTTPYDEAIEGSLTGYNKYGDFGVKVGEIKYTCYLPKKTLTKEEIFIHSLLDLSDPRMLAVSITFYLKNNLTPQKLEFLAMKYGVFDKLKELVILINTGNLSPMLPKITRRELVETLEVYDVKKRLRW